MSGSCDGLLSRPECILASCRNIPWIFLIYQISDQDKEFTEDELILNTTLNILMI